ncbi:related to Quinate permease [Melanopsichium pennsylvanicum]|uniref:Related to Quinate permease n=2 Tax=Melanopsichium pennsylvanicum TaxID=63383 RepID=A0AAJ4XPR2_9BASI|nr:related to Quinate permease [Melanopsichium pennsylvanicum 4]SNX85661.1 related to Quinate permease [Melanopsichium pennsylvanicum]
MLLAHLRDTPREARGWRLWFSAWAVGALGISRGLDEGIISGVLKQHSFVNTFGFDDNSPQEATIASQLQLGSVAGSAIAFFLCDRLGRLRTSMLACLLWIFGTAIWMTSAGIHGTHQPGNYHQLLAGRFIAGLGVGFTPVVAPVYLAEIAPKAIRGLCVCIFSGSVYIGILLGYFSNYGTSIHYSDARQWTVPASINFIFAGLTFIGCCFAKESPRWLIKQGRYEEGRKVLSYLRNLDADHPFVVNEVEVMEQQIEAEKNALKGLSFFQILKKLITNKNNQYILFLGLGIQVLGQMSGGGVYTIFAPKIFGLLGISGGQRTKFLTTGIFGIVKLLSSLAAAFFLVDMLGRKTAVTTGLLLQSLCSLYLALFLKFTAGVTKANETQADKSAATGAIFFFYLSGLAWAIGVNSVQYLTQTEMFDITVRALGVAVVSLVHFAMQYAATRTLNPMLNAWGNFGTFLFYSIIALAGCIFVFFFMPETAGMQLEDIHNLFEKPWYRIGVSAHRPANRKKSVAVDVEENQSADLAYSTQLGQKKSIVKEEQDEKKN